MAIAIYYAGLMTGVTSVNVETPLIRTQLAAEIDATFPKSDVCKQLSKIIAYNRFPTRSSKDVNLNAMAISPFLQLRGKDYCIKAIISVQDIPRESNPVCENLAADNIRYAYCYLRLAPDQP